MLSSQPSLVVKIGTSADTITLSLLEQAFHGLYSLVFNDFVLIGIFNNKTA